MEPSPLPAQDRGYRWGHFETHAEVVERCTEAVRKCMARYPQEGPQKWPEKMAGDTKIHNGICIYIHINIYIYIYIHINK